jgi:uncharacterized protein YjiS (DUF1127 family)
VERIMNAPYNLATGMPEHVAFRGPDVGGLLARIAAAARTWVARQQQIDQITRTLNRRSDRQLADMGLTRADIYFVARGKPLPAQRAAFDDSARPTVRPVPVLPLALMR